MLMGVPGTGRVFGGARQEGAAEHIIIFTTLLLPVGEIFIGTQPAVVALEGQKIIVWDQWFLYQSGTDRESIALDAALFGYSRISSTAVDRSGYTRVLTVKACCPAAIKQHLPHGTNL